METDMVAVVRGLQDAGLCVTLVDGGRQYTLVPTAAVPQVSSYSQPGPPSARTHPGAERVHCDTGSQAVDGHYTSSYKIAHCNIKPTSPPVLLTEFPPQKAEVYPGHGNFEIGGCGSGESGSPTRGSGSYRGGLCWPDRGSVRPPRPSPSPDPFASSLRKYPSMSPERSAEVVERLVNYAQLRNSKISRPECVYTERPLRAGRRYDCDSPEPGAETRPSRGYDVRCTRELPRKVRDNVKNITYPYSLPVCPSIRARYDHLPPDLKLADMNVTSMHMETQAEISMVSKEVTTTPREKPSTRNVAVPLSPASSCVTKPEKSITAKYSSKYIQTKTVDLELKIRKSVQTCFSSADLLESRKVNNKRKSKSQEELRQNYDIEDELIQFIQNLTPCPDFYRMRDKMLRKLNKVHKTDESERIKIGRCIKNQLYSEIDLKNFTRELSNELIAKIKQHSLYIGDRANVYRADVRSFKKNLEDNCIDELIKEWLNDIPLRNYLENDFQKEHLLETVANKIRTLVNNKLRCSSISTLKSDIIEIIDVIPIDVSVHSKRFYLNRLVSELLKKIKATFISSRSRKRWKKGSECSNAHIQPTEKELNQLVTIEMDELMNKFNLKICPDSLKQIEIEVTDILLNSTEFMRLDKLEEVKDEIVELLADFVNISEHQAKHFANNVVANLKDMYVKPVGVDDSRSQNIIVLQSSIQHNQVQPSKNNTDYSIQGVSESEINANLDFYTNEIIKQITEWANNIQDFDKIEENFKQVVIHDLASDIVDRHKYLELNPSSKKTEIDELEHLKYQIFKWMNKIVGEDNLEMINHASELMEKFKSIPVPMLTKPQHNLNNSKPYNSCCQNFNDMPGTSKTKNIQSPTKERRFNSPNHNKFQITATAPQQSEEQEMPQTGGGSMIMTAKEFMEQEPRRSSLPARSVSEKPCCKKNQIANQNESSSGARNEYILHEPNTNVPSTITDKPQIQTRQPQDDEIGPHDKNKPLRRTSKQSENVFRPKGRDNCNKTPETQKSNVLSSARLDSPNKTNKANCCNDTSSKSPLESPTVKQLNDEYDEFVKDWVEQIPIATSNPEEEALAQKARLGIYNGIWKAITKLKMNPAILSNPFYYQDVLDDEVEELLSYLPQTEELNRKKALLKAQLVEKTTNTNQLIINAAQASSFKQLLVDNISNNLPRKEIDYSGDDVAKLYEDMQKLNLAEDFILYTSYKERDRTKANVFKKKLMKEVQELIKLIKQNHGKELKDIDAAVYIDEVFDALQKVPLPSEDTIREEAAEIAIGHEIEQWFMDLPLMPNDDCVEQLGRRRYKDSLAKKIHDIEKQSSDAVDIESEFREEIRHFLRKMPIRPEETQNINFMAEELVNRLKNRPNDILATGGERRNGVCFIEAFDYDEFSRDMPICSSFSDSDKPAQANERSYMIAGGNRVEDTDYYGGNYDRNVGSTVESEQQWHTLQESTNPRPRAQSGQAMPSCCQSFQERRPSVAIGDALGQPSTQSTSSQTPAMRIPEQTESPQYANTFHQGCGQPFQQGPQMSRLGFDIDTANRSPDVERPNMECCSKGRRSSAPAAIRSRDASTRPLLSQTPEFQRHYSKNTSADYSEPMGYSTPQSRYPPSPRPKKKSREVEYPSRDAARRRLDFEKSDDDSEDEVRCRCMEKVWRCRRKKPVCPTCEESDYVPCFMRFPPHPCFY